jgi:hypothetical protein
MKLLIENWRKFVSESEKKDDDPCWDGYEQIGMKKKDGKEVPNCVPRQDEAMDSEEEYYEVDALSEDEEYCPVCSHLEEAKKKKKKPCKPSKGKRFAKRVSGKCRSYGQAGKAKGGGDRIRPGTKKGDAYCARSAGIKKCKNPPCANTLSRKKWKCRGKKSMKEGFLDFFKSDSTAPSNTDMSPEEREFHRQQALFKSSDWHETFDVYNHYKILMYGGAYNRSKRVDPHRMRLSRKAWTKLTPMGRRKRLRELAAFHDNVLRPTADKIFGFAAELESGDFEDATSRYKVWSGDIDPARIRKQLPNWAKSFRSALKVLKRFYENEAPKLGLDGWSPQPGLEDIKDFMDLASIQQ